VPDKLYMKRYIVLCEKYEVVYGGRSYTDQTPEDPEQYLRWLYGIRREVVTAEKRNRNPNKSFMTNNFCIKKKLFNQIKFNENIQGYGHEDTLFGYELKKRKILIHHINNPLVHIGLERNSVFLEKTENGLRNLKKIIVMHGIDSPIVEDIKILRWYRRFYSVRMLFIFKLCYLLFGRSIKRNLLGNSPNLRLFDLYKLLYMSMI
jgi:hypothetical protein